MTHVKQYDMEVGFNDSGEVLSVLLSGHTSKKVIFDSEKVNEFNGAMIELGTFLEDDGRLSVAEKNRKQVSNKEAEAHKEKWGFYPE